MKKFQNTKAHGLKMADCPTSSQFEYVNYGNCSMDKNFQFIMPCIWSAVIFQSCSHEESERSESALICAALFQFIRHFIMGG